VLARLCEAALAQDGGLFVDHADLPDAFFTAILPHFGIDPTETEDGPIGEIMRRNAKRPAAPYRPEAPAADPRIREAAATHFAGAGTRLGTVHARQSLL
jgi:hypothetical protein